MRPKRDRLRTLRRALTLVALLGVGLVVVGPVGVGASQTAGAASSPPRLVRAVVANDGLDVTVTALYARTSGTVRFTVRAVDAHTRGALGYDIAYGDGTSARSAVPQFCIAGNGVPRHDRWRLTHRYAFGTYRVRVTVAANCSAVAATAHLTVRHD